MPNWKGKIVSPGIQLFEAEAFPLLTDRSLPEERIKAILPHNLHITGRLDKPAGRSYIEQLLSDPTRFLNLFLLLPTDKNNAGESSMKKIIESLESVSKYGVGVGDPQYIKDIYFMSVADGELISRLDIPSLVTDRKFDPQAALVLFVIPQRHIS